MRLKPIRHTIERNQLVDFKAGADDGPFRVFHQHFRHQRPAVVGAGLHRPIGARRHDGEQRATWRLGQMAVAGEEIAAFADRPDHIGANPAGGCLPLVIQMPFLFAFYSMLGVALELRHAPFLWLHDLSSPDKLFILPVLIVVSTLFVQKMTPNAGMDPKQQQMMTLMMPLMIGFFSYSLPAGLSVYWTVGNFIAIAQQYIMNRTGLGREMREEMEKRARKKAGK